MNMMERIDAAIGERDAEIETLRVAAQAVVDRWHTPLWKDVEATAAFISRLEAALAGKEGKLFRGMNKVERLETALRHISLASQSSQSSKEECGRIARAALAEVKDA